VVSAEGSEPTTYRLGVRATLTNAVDETWFTPCPKSIAFDGSGAQPVIGSTKPLFAIDNLVLIGNLFDVSPDGQRILLNAVPAEAPSSIELVVNWPTRIKK
jgi:hypothetical protein